MSTWTFKVFAGGLLAALIGGCVPLPDGSSSSSNALAPPLTTAKLGRGLSVATPRGYCLDPSSISRNFALIARCDRLGAEGESRGTPLAVITVTAPSGAANDGLPTARALVGDTEALLDSYRQERLQLVKVAGTAPAEGLSGRYWRGAGLIDGKLLGLAIYPTANGPDLDEDAVVLLRETFQRSSDETLSASKTARTASAKAKKSVRTRFGGLLN